MTTGAGPGNGELLRLVGELIALRRRELRVLRGIEALLLRHGATAMADEAAASAARLRSATPGGASATGGGGGAGLPGVAAGHTTTDGAALDPPPVTRREDPGWIDRAIDAALARAFSGPVPGETGADGVEPPAGGVELPAAGVEPPSAGVEPPAARVELPPSAAVELPAAGVEPPSAGVEPPAARVELPPSAAVELPTAGVEPPAAGVKPPAASVGPPSPGVEIPASGAAGPAAVGPVDASTPNDVRSVTRDPSGSAPPRPAAATAPETVASTGARPGAPSTPAGSPAAASKSGSAAERPPLPPEDPELLLLRSGQTWVGFPWADVGGIGLAEEAEDDGSGASLAWILREDVSGPPPAEPYRITWETSGGTRALLCEVLGSVVAASVAATRGVELVLSPGPATGEGAEPCQVRTLVEFLVEPRVRVEAPPRRPDVGLLERLGLERRAEVPAPEARSCTSEPDAPATPAPEPEAGVPETPAPVVETAPQPGPEPQLLEDAGTPPAVDAGDGLPPPRTAVSDEVSTESPGIPEDTVPASEPAPVGGGPDPRVADSPANGAPAARATGPAALVAVRYLPARVTISRQLRALGWFVTEAADNQELPSLIRRLPYRVVFAEAPETPELAWMEAVRHAREARIPVFAVASRLSWRGGRAAAASGAAARLLYPFHESEVEKLLAELRPAREDG